MSAPLLIEHFLDTAAYSINHIEIHHSPAQTFIAEMRLRFFVLQSIFQSARNKCACIGIIQIAWIFYKIDALLKRVVLMGNTVVECLTNGVVVILLHRVWEKRTSWHLTQRQVLYL